MNKIRLFDIDIDLLDRESLVNKIVDLSVGPKSTVGYVNTKALNLAYEEERFARFLRRCSAAYVDGYGPILAARLLGQNAKKEHRNTCPDFLDLLLDTLAKEQKKIFFLGNSREVINNLHPILREKHPSLNYKAHHGFFAKKGPENQAVIQKINRFQPDILFVGFGMPLQEYWIEDNFNSIHTNLFLPEGACLDFYTDSVYRGPEFLTDNGLEWVARLVTEPKRLWKRYLIGNPRFLFRIWKDRNRG